MKTRSRIASLSVFALSTFTLHSQNILAGQHGAYDYYQDIADTLLYVQPQASGSETFSVDINGDMVDDLQFGSARSTMSGWYDEKYSWVQPLNMNQVCYLGWDSCFGDDAAGTFAYRELMANPFTTGTNIDRNYNWKDTTLKFAHGGWNVNGPTGVPYSCSMSTFGSSSSYLGVRVVLSTDTFYGWVKLQLIPASYCDSLIIDAYACQTSLTGISNSSIDNSATLFPQPANEQLHVQLAQPTYGETFAIYDAFGRLIREEKIGDGSSSFEISTSTLPSGVYQYALLSGEHASRGKFLVTH